MSLSLILGSLWVLAATITAFLPYRAQFPPGIFLLFAAPVLIGFIGYEHGPLWAGLAALGFASMFRNPLIYFARRALGRPRRGDPTPPPASPPGPPGGERR